MTATASISRPNTKPAAHELTSNANAVGARLKALPASAQQKFERLRRAELRSRALIDGLSDHQRRVRESRDLALRDLGIFDRRHPPEFTYEVSNKETGERKSVPVVFPERAALVERIESDKSELARLADEQQAANLGYSTEGLLDWLASQSAKFVAAPVPFVKPAKGETLTDALARNREAQATVNAELATAQNAGRTVAECKLAMRAQVDLLAEKGRPDVANLFNGHAIAWPTEQFTAGGHGAHQYIVAATVNDALALTVWAHRAAIIAQLDAEIERAGDDATALSAEAQGTRIAECEAALLQLQRQAEAIAERLEGDGITVRRTCTDPIVLLGIEQLRQ
jgi:hypothetical protein